MAELTEQYRDELDGALARARVLDGSPSPLLTEADRRHILHLLAPVVARMIADACDQVQDETLDFADAHRDQWIQRGADRVTAAVEAMLDGFLPTGGIVRLIRAALSDPDAALSRGGDDRG